MSPVGEFLTSAWQTPAGVVLSAFGVGDWNQGSAAHTGGRTFMHNFKEIWCDYTSHEPVAAFLGCSGILKLLPEEAREAVGRGVAPVLVFWVSGWVTDKFASRFGLAAAYGGGFYLYDKTAGEVAKLKGEVGQLKKYKSGVELDSAGGIAHHTVQDLTGCDTQNPIVAHLKLPLPNGFGLSEGAACQLANDMLSSGGAFFAGVDALVNQGDISQGVASKIWRDYPQFHGNA